MKFLTISSYKDSYASLSAEEKRKVGLADTEYILDLKKKMGDKLTFYSIAGWGRYVSIGEYGSLEEYAQTVQGPSNQAGYSNMESYPLIEWDIEQVKAYLEQAKTAK